MNNIRTYFNLSNKLYRNLNIAVTKRLCSSLTSKQEDKTEILSLKGELENIDWNSELTKLRIEDQEAIFKPNTDDLSCVGPYTRPTFNFAAYINKSETLKKLVQLGVNLHKIEKRINAPEFIMKLDFETDIKKYVFFLHDLGVSSDNLGKFITINPFIFQEDIDTLKIRINYLESKAFTKDMITTIISKNPYWLMFSTERIDTRLGHFQKTFKLTGKEVRTIATSKPKLITYSISHIKSNTFSIKEEMGFTDEEMKKLLLMIPKLWMMNKDSLLRRFEYVHNTMNMSHTKILQMPKILTCRKSRIQQRHQFLVKLGRAQYDPMKENYISVEKIIEGTDAEFCANTAKSSVETFNTFLKSL